MPTRDLLAKADLFVLFNLANIDASAVTVAERLRASEHCNIILCCIQLETHTFKMEIQVCMGTYQYPC